jgi:hypothetical protein
MNELVPPLRLKNLTNDGNGRPRRIHRRHRPSRKLVPFGSEIWSARQLGKKKERHQNHGGHNASRIFAL